MYIGIDCSSFAIHIAKLDEDGKLLGLYKVSSKKKTADERLLDLALGFDAIIENILKTNKNVAIEKPVYVRNIRGMMTLVSVIAIVKVALFRNKVNFTLVDNKTWKKEVLGNGNSSKEQIMSFAERKWQRVFEEQDYADAACIAEYGRKHD